ncbi:hypothetical protein GCM10025867_38890 [Frondihabitans sucicola]|uniref:DUF4333 domain-containing protein n=1 Tax=Frondihabitans sucicola TaxID=1268041 RepID=A0ABN6Y6N3_9MICO|nr:DUF4333 domain-containing protein [Frondihabitans sucicola]BDZ51648.1 hypothetical protein GCM10025867_38890 [Frondihabitans sucicola]
MTVDKAINRPARNGLALGILSALIVVLVVGATIATDRIYVVWSLWTVAGLVCSIVGYRRARRWEEQGFIPVGVRRAIAGIILCSVALLAQGTETGLALATGGIQPIGRAPTTDNGSSAAGSSSHGSSGSPTTAPVVAVLQGDGTSVYSQAQAQTAIGAAYAATLKAAPTGVVCPATEPIQVSVTFPCTVTITGGTSTVAQVTVVDAQGHVEVQVH